MMLNSAALKSTLRFIRDTADQALRQGSDDPLQLFVTLTVLIRVARRFAFEWRRPAEAGIVTDARAAKEELDELYRHVAAAVAMKFGGDVVRDPWVGTGVLAGDALVEAIGVLLEAPEGEGDRPGWSYRALDDLGALCTEALARHTRWRDCRAAEVP